MLELGVKFLLSYFIGSIMGALLIGRLRGGVDIRTAGSGNAGGTNALRTQGWLFALGVVVIDVGKGAIGAGLIPVLDLPFIDEGANVAFDWLVVCCAAAAVIGHVWPIWHDFRGGKGAATLIGTLIVMSPMLIAPVLVVWSAVLVLTGYVGLSTMCAGIAAPLWLALTTLPADQPLFIYCVAMAAYLVFSHRSNIRRMRTGTENRMTRAMLFRRQS
jgi:glycerol-3-phosphate acyltransferase PlsY